MYTERLWYAVQRDAEDDWGTGSFNKDEAIRMLMADEDNSLIAVIENDVCVEEIWKKDI